MKSDLCSRCKAKPQMKESEVIQINDLVFLIKPHYWLCIACLEKELRNKFEQLKEQGLEFVKKRDGVIKVDWKMIDGFEEESKNFAYDILLAMDTMSMSAEGNWQIFADSGIILNPRRFPFVLYFKKEQDVIDFATSTLSNTLYSWEIQHITKVFTKSDIIEQE